MDAQIPEMIWTWSYWVAGREGTMLMREDFCLANCCKSKAHIAGVLNNCVGMNGM